MIMKPGKSKTCRVGWLERSVLQSGLQVACRQNSFLVWKGQPSVLLRPSNDWLSPTRIMKSSLLYLMSTVIFFSDYIYWGDQVNKIIQVLGTQLHNTPSALSVHHPNSSLRPSPCALLLLPLPLAITTLLSQVYWSLCSYLIQQYPHRNIRITFDHICGYHAPPGWPKKLNINDGLVSPGQNKPCTSRNC